MDIFPGQNYTHIPSMNEINHAVYEILAIRVVHFAEMSFLVYYKKISIYSKIQPARKKWQENIYIYIFEKVPHDCVLHFMQKFKMTPKKVGKRFLAKSVR